MPAPLAYFLTWTTHGTWLHGDERGSIDKEHNTRGASYVAPNVELQARMRERMKDRTLVLAPDMRGIVERTIRDHCDFRQWELFALNVRSNHVHIVVRCELEVSPESAMSQFKAWSTRRLREGGYVGKESKVWTEHGSTRWIDSQSSLASAIDYVMNHQ